jgi:hypothetical protein
MELRWPRLREGVASFAVFAFLGLGFQGSAETFRGSAEPIGPQLRNG